MKRVLLGVVAILFVLLSLEAYVGYQAAEEALHPQRKLLAANATVRLDQVAASSNARWRDVRVQAADGAELRGWVIQPAHSNGDAVILLHGHGDNRLGMLGPASMLLRHGYAVLLPDARAHGESGGAIATYGVLEAEDVRHWYDWLEANLHPGCIDGYGASMGAAAVLESLATTPGYCAVVADSPFASFREVSYDRVGQKIGVGDWFGRSVARPVVDFGFLWTRLLDGQNLEMASPLQAVVQSRIPVLLIHGEQDTNVPIRHSHLILVAARNRQPAVQFWAVPNAEHTKAMQVDPAGFEQRVTAWFASHRREEVHRVEGGLEPSSTGRVIAR